MRVTGFVMTDESGEVLAVSVGGSADLVKSLAAPKSAPESPAELVDEHKRLVGVLRSPSHADDLEEADRQEAELAEYEGEMSKAHVKGYTRKDGTFVKEHDDKRQAAQAEQASVRPVPSQKVNALSDKHSGLMHRKESEWQHGGKKVPASDVSGLPEFSHREVYGHDGKTSPAGTNFSKEFADKAHQGFVLKHPDGKRSFVDTQGSNYARYHAPVEDAPAAGGGAGASASSLKDEARAAKENMARMAADDAKVQRLRDHAAAGEKNGGFTDPNGHLGKPTYDHPNVVGKADFGAESPEKGFSMKFAGTHYAATGKTGNSNHDQTPVREFASDDDHRVWADGAGRVHADSRSEVAGLRQKFEASVKPAGGSGGGLGSHKVGDRVSYSGERGATRTGKVKGVRDGKVIVEHKAGYTELKHHHELSPVSAKAAAKGSAPAVETQNEGYGFHGEAYNQHLSDKLGPDNYYSAAKESDHVEAGKAAAKRFDDAAKHLVSAGHFGSPEEARDYLDSTHGRHLHDAATSTGGDISKVSWLAKDVAAYKRRNGGGSMAKSLFFVGSNAAAAELAELAMRK